MRTEKQPVDCQFPNFSLRQYTLFSTSTFLCAKNSSTLFCMLHGTLRHM